MSATNAGERPSGPLLTPPTPAPSAPGPNAADPAHDRGNTAARTSKFTFYFTEEQLTRLDLLWETVLRACWNPQRRVSKSEVVRPALDRLLTDFECNPEAVTAALLQQLAD